MSWSYRLLVASFSSVMIVGCVTPLSQVTMIQAPEVEAASRYKSISITRFSGNGGDGITSAVETALINAKIQDKAVYRSVQKAGDSRSLGVDSRSLASTARSLGTDAIMTGEVVNLQVNDAPYQETEYVCDAVDPKHKWKCVSGRNVAVNCLKRTASLQVNVTLIDAQTGASVYHAAIPRRMEESACKGAQLKPGSAMIGELSVAIVDQVKRAVVPHERVMNVVLLRSGDDLSAPGARDRFAGALKFADAGRMDRACETFRELYEADKRSISLMYDLGVCEESVGSFWRANELYRSADKLSIEPNPLINGALVRSEQAIKKAGNLAKNRSDLVDGSKIDSPTPKAAPVIQQVMIQGGVPNITADMLMWDKRVALVIGNGKYPKSELLNPPNDAVAIADELRKANFRVIKVENASFAKMNQAIEEFGRSIKPGGVALVFYAGHGMQVNGENYLIPVDADLKGESDVRYKTVNLGQILSKLEDAKSQVNLVILDACRDNPFARSWRSFKGGLATIDAPSGTVIAFATAPGKTASDGSGSNGLYTTHLLDALRIPNLRLEDVLKATRKGVAASSNNEQIPWDSSSLTGEFFFKVSKMEPSVALAPLQTAVTASPLATATTTKAEPSTTSRSVGGSENAAPQATEGSSGLGNLFNSLGGFLRGQ